MRRPAAIVFCLAMLCAVPAKAQDSTSAPPQSSSTPASTTKTAATYNPRATPLLEISGGYSYRAYSPTPQTTFKLNGGYVAADYNIFSWIGVAGEATGAVRKQGAGALGTSQTLSIFTGLVGPQVYPLRHRKVTFFTHFLVGEGYYYLRAPAFGGFSTRVTTSNGFAWEGGGGLDVRIKSHWSLRLVEGDYGETSFYVAQANAHQVGYRLSAGIVYLRGQK